MLDIKIIGGLIVDGSGAPGYLGDVGIRDGKIVAIGQVEEAAAETIDAIGKAVTPGFIDVHTHYDAQIFWDPALSPSCFHGVTTVLGGFCGFSIAPLTPESARYLLPMLARVEGMPVKTLEMGVPWDWSSFGSYLDRLDGRAGLNVGFFAGHSAIRRAVMGERAVGCEATEDEIRQMEAMLDAALSEGALGFSTTKAPGHNDGDGNPVPSRFASRDEMLRLASVVSRHEGTSLELLPDLAFDQDTIDLMTDFSLAGQRMVNWNVLSVYGADEENVERANMQLDVSDYARERGAHILALTVPSTANVQINLYSGFIFDSIPNWDMLFKQSPDKRMELLGDPALRDTLKEGATRIPDYLKTHFDWPKLLVAETFSEANAGYKGRMVGEIAESEGKHPVDALFDIALADGLKTSFMPQRGGEDLASYEFRSKLWLDDRTLIGASDAGAHMDMIDTFAFSTRVLENGVRIHKVIELEAAVHQLTSLPAERMGIKDRGLLQPGKWADVAIFDPDTIACGPTYTRYDLPGDEARLYADAIGISHVIVNGQVIVRDGAHSGAMPGTVMRSGRDTYTQPLPAANIAA